MREAIIINFINIAGVTQSHGTSSYFFFALAAAVILTATELVFIAGAVTRVPLKRCTGRRYCILMIDYCLLLMVCTWAILKANVKTGPAKNGLAGPLAVVMITCPVQPYCP